MTKYVSIQKPIEEGKFSDGSKWEIYEEFGCYGVYIEGRMKSMHDSLSYARQKIERIKAAKQIW